MTSRTSNLDQLIERARNSRMPAEAQEAQRRSFAYGNTKIENDRITKETIDVEAERLAKDDV